MIAQQTGSETTYVRSALRAAGIEPHHYNSQCLSPGVVEETLAAYRAGDSSEIMARRFGITPKGIRHRIHRYATPEDHSARTAGFT